MSSAAAQPLPQAPPVKKAKKKHWVLRIFFGLAIILLLIALVVQIVLWTDLPRGIVVSQIEGQLGLRLSVKSLSTNWFGHTQLNDVTIGLPLSDKAFLDVPVMKVKNTSLFGLIIGRPVEVQAIELDQPHLYVVQDAAGQWNLQQVAELLARAGGKKSGQESAATSSTPQMPNVHLTGGIVSIVDNKNRSIEIQPLSVDGYSDTGVSWKYDVQVPSKVSLSGRLVPGGNWGHEVALKVSDISLWAKPWNKDFPKTDVDVDWHGELTSAGVSGRLDIRKAAIALKTGQTQAYGGVRIEAGSAGVSLQPDNLLLKTGIAALPDFRLVSGMLSLDPAAKIVKADQLLVSVFGGAVKVGADYNLNTSAANLNVAWNQLSLGTDITHSGGLALTLRKPFPDRVVLEGHLTSAGNEGPGLWLASANFNATGQSFSNLSWKIDADKLQWQRHVQGVNLDGLTLTGAVRDDSVTLTSITLPNKDLLSGNAGYALTGGQPWEAHLRGQRWPFKPIPGTELGFTLDARGDKTKIILDNFSLKSPDAVISANAMYTFGNPKPLTLNLSIVNAPPTQVPVALAATPQAKLFNGTIDGHFKVDGTLDPLKLDVGGELDGREVDVRGHPLGDIRLAISKQSHVDSNGVFVYTDAVALLGGKLGIDGVYVPDWNDLTVNVDIRGLQLEKLADVIDRDDLSGSVDGHIHISVPGMDFRPGNIVIPPATFAVKNINAHDVLVDQLDATLWMQQGHFEINPLHLKHAEGTADLIIATDLNDFRKIEIKNLDVNSWPIDLQGAAAHINASIDIPKTVIHLPDPLSSDSTRRVLRVTAHEIDFSGITTLKGEKLGDLTAHAGIEGRELDIRGVHLKLLGGRFDGQAHASFDNPLSSTAELTWENLDFKKLALIFPQVNEMTGQMTGGVRIAPTTVPRPREPLAIVMTTKFAGGHWRTVPVQDLRLAAYVGPNDAEFGGGWRVVMEDSKLDPSFIHAADGTVELWGRAGIGGRAASSQGQIIFRDLNLNTMVHALSPAAAQMPGKIAGSVMLIRAPTPEHPPARPTDQMFPGRPTVVITPVATIGKNDPPLKKLIDPIYAEGHVELTQTNLANFGPFAALYNAAKLFQDVNKPIGFGNGDFHLERGAISLERLRYFNRGTEIRTVATVKDISKGKDAGVNATVTLLAQPLKGAKLPFISDLGEAFTAIQKSLPLTAVRVVGTLDKYKIIPLGISELGQQMRDLLVNDAKSDSGPGAN